MLTEKQQAAFDMFFHKIKQKENCFLSSEDRRIGKTFTLNELAFTLQALGYRVLILTPYRDQEYFAEKFISLDALDYRGIFQDNTVVIADEAKYEIMADFLEYCSYKNVPVVGYVDFRSRKPVKTFDFRFYCAEAAVEMGAQDLRKEEAERLEGLE